MNKSELKRLCAQDPYGAANRIEELKESNASLRGSKIPFAIFIDKPGTWEFWWDTDNQQIMSRRIV